MLLHVAKWQEMKDGKIRWAFSPEMVLRVQLRLIFEASGRTTDFGWGKGFSAGSARFYKAFLDAHLSLPVGGMRQYGTSNYRRMHDELSQDEDQQITLQSEAFSAIKGLVNSYCSVSGIDPPPTKASMRKFRAEIEEEVLSSMKGDMEEELLRDPSAVCARMYTSTKKIEIAGRRRELCFFINGAIRLDAEECLSPVLPLVRCINFHLLHKLRTQGARVVLPPTQSTQVPGYFCMHACMHARMYACAHAHCVAFSILVLIVDTM